MSAFPAAPETYLLSEKTHRRHPIVGYVQSAENPDVYLPIVNYGHCCRVTDPEPPWVISCWPALVKVHGTVTTEEA
jgi:hypothetical protein